MLKREVSLSKIFMRSRLTLLYATGLQGNMRPSSNLGFHYPHSSIEHPHRRQLSHGLESVSAAGT